MTEALVCHWCSRKAPARSLPEVLLVPLGPAAWICTACRAPNVVRKPWCWICGLGDERHHAWCFEVARSTWDPPGANQDPRPQGEARGRESPTPHWRRREHERPASLETIHHGLGRGKEGAC